MSASTIPRSLPGSPTPRPPHRPIRVTRTFGAWAIVVVIGVIAGAFVFDRLSTSLDPVASSESIRTERRIEQLTKTAGSIVILAAGDPRLAPTAGVIRKAAARLDTVPGVVRVTDYTATNDAQLLASDGTASLIVASVAAGLDDDAGEEVLAAVTEISNDVLPGAQIAGGLSVDAELGATAETDLARADLVAIPIVLLLLAVALRSRLVIAFGLALIVATVTGSSAFVYALSLVTDVSVFAVNVVTMFAVGLTVDYGLLFIGAFQQHLSTHHRSNRSDTNTTGVAPDATSEVNEAINHARSTAGHTIIISGLTVAAALTGLLVFHEPVLRSLGFGGIGATLFAITAANTLLPALLARYGHRMSTRIDSANDHASTAASGARFARLATAVQRRPVLAVAFGIGVLAILGAPLTGLRAEGLDVRSLAIDSPLRVTVSHIAEKFPASRTEPITILATANHEAPELAIYTATLRKLNGVTTVMTTSLGSGHTRIDVVPAATSADHRAQRLVNQMRDNRPGFPIAVTGEAAEDLDFTTSLTERIPLAVTVVAVMTLLLLWALTGSVLIPIKAVVISALSLAASIGVMVWGFQDGHLAGLLNITPIGGLEPVIVLLTCVFAFGLSTDYEVFLLAAVLDARLHGEPTPMAITTAIRTTGRTITTAAALLVVVFVGFATGDLLIIKQLGVGLIVAVALDVTLVRLILVPATLTLFGNANWWNPPFLQRLHRRLPIALRHRVTAPGAAVRAT